MTQYVFDSSAIIDAGERYYPIDVFESFWTRMDGLILTGDIIAPEFLIDELAKKDDSWRDWVYERRDQIIVPMDADILNAVSEVMTSFPGLVDVNKNRSGGDPFFIALAKVTGATLVTGEKSGSPSKPRIPDVCTAMRIPHTNILGFIRAEAWKF